MAAVLDEPLAADHHVADRVGVAGEHQAVEHQVADPTMQGRVGAVEHQQIGPSTRRQTADRPAERLGAAGERRLPERGADRAAGAGDQQVAGPMGQALAVFQPSELFRRADRDLAVGADAEPDPFRARPGINPMV